MGKERQAGDVLIKQSCSMEIYLASRYPKCFPQKDLSKDQTNRKCYDDDNKKADLGFSEIHDSLKQSLQLYCKMFKVNK